MTWTKWWQRGNAPIRRLGQRGPWSRRAFLGGGAAVITLPFLESLRGGAWAGPLGSPCPVRSIFVYVPNGMMMADWTPSATGANYDLPRILAPLASVQDQVSVISGLDNPAAVVPVPGDHARGTGSFLSCVTVEHTSGDDISNGISADQVIANAIGGQTLFPSIELGCVGGTPVGDCDSGYSCAYTRNISWADETTPMAKLTDPSIVFDRLFAGLDLDLSEEDRERRKRWRSSVLDTVTEDANRLNLVLSQSDRNKLDEYLTGIRDLEARIQSGFDGECLPGEEPTTNLPYEQQVPVMNDLIVQALACDLTRVATFMLENAGSNRSFDFLGVTGAHHELSHHQNVESTTESLVTIGTWEVEQFAHLVSGLAGVTEADGSTLLDNSLVFFSSEIADGDSHSHYDLPVLLAGSGGGAHNPGRHIDAEGAIISELFLSMMYAAGVTPGGFADAQSPLDLLG